MSGEPPGRRGAAFFDRDGVLNRDVAYAHKPEQIEWITGAAEAVRLANEAGLVVVVVTNQSGVARGYFSEADVQALHDWMTAQLAAQDARIDRFYYSPFHKTAVNDAYRVTDHPDRKPNPGMLLRAIKDFDIDPARSFLIGDQISDVLAGARAGVASYRFHGKDLPGLVRQAIAELGDQGG